MKYVFKKLRFSKEFQSVINDGIRITDDYLQQGLRLTLRQLYYQYIALDVLPESWRDPISKSKNNERSYSKVSSLISRARLTGLIDWEAIEDRTRIPQIPNEFQDLAELVRAAEISYRLPRWRPQPNYIELWTEKDALAGVLRPLADKYHIPLIVNRGYASQTAMYEASNRFIDKFEDKQSIILYLGDFDPSGEDMVRDIQDRMEMFNVYSLGVKKIALTLDQIHKYKPPPNPAKIKDPRAAEFIRKYGASSWEVDAISPKELQKIVISNIDNLLDFAIWGKVLQQEQKDLKKLKKAINLK